MTSPKDSGAATPSRLVMTARAYDYGLADAIETVERESAARLARIAELEREVSTWEWVKKSVRTNADKAVIVRAQPDGNFSFLHGDPTLELERELAKAEAALAGAFEQAAKVCHEIAMEAFTEREAQRNGDCDYVSISEETGRYIGAEECERAIRKLAQAQAERAAKDEERKK